MLDKTRTPRRLAHSSLDGLLVQVVAKYPRGYGDHANDLPMGG
ncbi:hypothetical protein [Pseudomonas paralcaligenes]